MIFFPGLHTYTNERLQEFDLIPDERKGQLARLADYISRKIKKNEPVALNFICTHNSRRSHISQIWAATAAAYYGLDTVSTFSGGTEATAFNPRAVAAFERIGFRVVNPGGDNPHYLVSFTEDQPPLECFSKVYDDPFNPEKNFAAIMTCSHADENCPFIPGAELRLPLTYNDPKESDDTERETVIYDERVRQIGRELFYAMSKVQK